MPLYLRYLACFCALSFLVFTSCDNDELDFVTGDSVELRFSTDTIMFDTVFTDRGSATQIMKIYNPSSDPVMLDRITVSGATGVRYNFNIDGFQGPEARNVPIFAEDSIFLFVEVFVDPTAPENISPFVAEDKLVIETGNNRSDITLIAFGQNANYLNGFRRGEFALISCDGRSAALPTDLPTVIFGSLVVDDCTLQALAGTRIFFHGGIQRNPEVGGDGFFNDGIIFVQNSGRIELLGELDNPVILRTDRLEERFRNQPGGYRGLIIGPGSRGNRIEHTEIFNAIAGVTLDSAAEVTIENSTIAFTGGPAVSGFQSDVTVRNSLFHSNFGNAIQFQQGGNLDLDHVTVANYGVDANALFLRSFSLDRDENVRGVAQMNANVRNSILAGSRENELILNDTYEGQFFDAMDITIENSVVRTNADFLQGQGGLFADFYTENCTDCVNSTFRDLLFRDIDADDYRMDSLGVARNLGVFLPSLPLDIRGVERPADGPDAGAFQFVPGEME